MSRKTLFLAAACLAAACHQTLAIAHDPSDSAGPHFMTPEVLKQRLLTSGFTVQGPITRQGINYNANGVFQNKEMELVVDRQTGDIFERSGGRLQKANFGPPIVPKSFVGSADAAATPLPTEVLVRPLPPMEALEIVRPAQ